MVSRIFDPKVTDWSNRNAVSVEKMSQAFQVGASTAKQAGLSIDEYVSLVGTASSATQRSGSEINW